jgi:hypothetical protein
MSVKKPKRNTRTPVAVNNEASAVLQRRGPAPQLSLQHMERTLRWMGEQLDGLRALIRLMLALAQGRPEEIQAAGLPQGCPGWGHYSTDLMLCGVCRWNLDCMTAAEERTEPARDQ